MRTSVKPIRVKNAALGPGQGQFDPKQAVENALILNPKVPSIQLAEQLAKEAIADPVFVQSVLTTFFFASLMAARKKDARAKNAQYQLPGFEHLPLRVLGKRKKRVVLLDATYEDVSRWVRHLSARRPDTPKLTEAKALLEKMSIASKTDRGITVRRVLGL